MSTTNAPLIFDIAGSQAGESIAGSNHPTIPIPSENSSVSQAVEGSQTGSNHPTIPIPSENSFVSQPVPTNDASPVSSEDNSIVRLIRYTDEITPPNDITKSIEIPKDSILIILTRSGTTYNAATDANTTANEASLGLFRFAIAYVDENNNIKNYGRYINANNATSLDVFDVTAEIAQRSSGSFHIRRLDTEKFDLGAQANLFEGQLSKFLSKINITIPYSGDVNIPALSIGGSNKTKKRLTKITHARTIKNLDK